MVYDRDRKHRNDEVYAEHRAALARGEKRILQSTTNGELHSYREDEIGFLAGSGTPQVRTWWGMGILFCLMVVLGLGTLVVVFLPLASGGSAPWGVLFVTVFAGLLGWYFFGLARDEYRATKIRRSRGTPDPGDR
ncbi:hypothetical protein [Streptomyces sp. NPDC058045]|uniref:hypothetical protein n=1 Tax=Streptomyces sp. NPDC058045 TaxID=3346311 RepID=UPI0036F11439